MTVFKTEPSATHGRNKPLNNFKPRPIVLAALVVAGFATLNGLLNAGGADLDMQWTLQQYIRQGRNPYDVYAQWMTERECSPGIQPQDAQSLDPRLGIPNPTYPPWTWFYLAPILWPDDPETARILYTAVHLAILAYASWWIVRRSGISAESVPLAWAATFAVDAVGATLAFGQLGLLVVGALLAAYEADRRGRPLLAGLLLGFSFLKPTISGPFLLVFLVRGRWRTVIVAGILTAVGGTVIAASVGTNPLRMMRQMEIAGTEWKLTGFDRATDPSRLLTLAGLPSQAALRLAVPLCTGLAFAAMIACRRTSTMTLYALAAMTSLIWVCHFHYDDLILWFVLFAWFEVLRRRPTILGAAAFTALGLTLWFPQFGMGFLAVFPWWGHPAYDWTLLLVQLASTVLLVVHARAEGTFPDVKSPSLPDSSLASSSSPRLPSPSHSSGSTHQS